MRFVSWNVNGIRAVLKKNFLEVFDAFNADIFAIQETKCQVGQVELDLPGYHQYWSAAEKKGYSGTAVFTREEPLQVLHGLGNEYLDAEGRIVACEFPQFWFVNVYTPNSQMELARIDHRMEWDDAFRDFCKGLEAGVLPDGASSGPKPVVMCGDFNVAHEDIDLKNPGPNRGASGFSDEERGKFTELVDAGFTDTFRLLHPDETGRYSWWSYRFRARSTNAGWRIDYFLVSDALRDHVVAASIYDDVEGSDHCPVGLELDIYMLKITVVAVGKLKEKFWVAACDEYLKRLRPYAKVTVAEIPDVDPARAGGVEAAREREGAGILAAVPEGAHVILMAIEGKQRSSVDFSRHLDDLALRGASELAFVIGGSDGVSDAVRARADETFSFGPITLPHNLARVVLLEQLYRAFKISRGEPYHK